MDDNRRRSMGLPPGAYGIFSFGRLHLLGEPNIVTVGHPFTSLRVSPQRVPKELKRVLAGHV